MSQEGSPWSCPIPLWGACYKLSAGLTPRVSDAGSLGSAGLLPQRAAAVGPDYTPRTLPTEQACAPLLFSLNEREEMRRDSKAR